MPIIENFITNKLYIPPVKSFKERKNLMTRKLEYANLKAKFPNKVTVVIERYAKERNLPFLDKTKFLVPEDLQVSKLLMIIRNRMDITENQAIYLMTANKTMLTMSRTMAEVYEEHRDEDGFVYLTYASQSVFG